MNSFYIEGRGEPGHPARLSGEEAKHAFQVLRLRPGEEIYAVDESGARFLAELTEVSKTECVCEIREALPDNEPPVRVTVYQGLPKADKLDFIAQKLTELGAVRVAPVKMERSVVKLDGKDAEKRRERLRRIAREAAKQCKRGRAAEVLQPMTWKQLAGEMEKHDLLLVPWEDAEGYGLKAAHGEFPDARDIGVVIGPEGGMSAAEVDALKEALPDNEPPVRVTVYQGLPKADKLDLIAQKLTELGAARVAPVKMERSVVKLDGKDAEKRRERLQRIAREAAKQCKRGRAPEVLVPQTWKQLEPEMRKHDLLLVPWEDAEGCGLSAAHGDCPDARDIGIVIGPEGGMSAAEVDALTAIGAKPITLGPRILRTETAAVAACAMTMLLWGDLG